MIYGLVGRSGSGKSTAAEVFAQHGCYVIDCDKVAADILNSDESVRAELAKAFGADVLCDGGVNRRLLAERAFADRESLDKLNSITHPPIIKRAAELAKGKDRVVLDAPTLFESGADKLCDKIIAVVSNDEECVKRLLLREGAEEAVVRKRLEMQKSEEFLRSVADIIIESDTDFYEYKRRIEDVAKTL